MTLEQHRAQNQAKNARRWTAIAAEMLDSARFFRDDPLDRDVGYMRYELRGALRCIRDHSRKLSTISEASRLLAILETR